jgi:hypothetical protein
MPRVEVPGIAGGNLHFKTPFIQKNGSDRPKATKVRKKQNMNGT